MLSLELKVKKKVSPYRKTFFFVGRNRAKITLTYLLKESKNKTFEISGMKVIQIRNLSRI